MDDWLSANGRLVAPFVVALGLLCRLWAASGTFLNPDEALHFRLANQSSLALAYKASLTTAHPPLLFFLLYWLRHLAHPEMVLRLPSVIAGTALCWVFFKWLNNSVGSIAGWIGLILMTFLPPLITLSAEVRQYALVLFFLATATYLLDRGLKENSAGLRLGVSCKQSLHKKHDAREKMKPAEAPVQLPARAAFADAGCGCRSVRIAVALEGQGNSTGGVAAASIAAYYLLFNASFPAVPGDWSYGPRYLAAGLPLLCLGLAPVWSRAPLRWRRVLVGLALWSGMVTLMAVSTTAQPPAAFKCPLPQLFWPNFWAGNLSINRGSVLTRAEEGLGQTRGAFNLGELAGWHGLTSLIPLLAVWCFAAFLWIRMNAAAKPQPAPASSPEN